MLDKTIEYEYNTNTGNLESVTTRKGSGTPTTTTFGYDNDRLTSLGGKAITYNANGGVASYNGWNYTWNKGKLSSIGKNLGSSSRAIITPILGPNKTYSFSYNGLGQRVRQSYSHFWLEGDIISVHQGEVTAYTKDYTYDHSGRLICETIYKTLYGIGNESSKIVYLYDESGIVGIQYTIGTTTNTYYFLRNLQGDVIAIYDTNGAEIASYSYDAWGNCTINSTTTNYSVAHANPIRYRGYYYDEDTKLYYLNARYYSPEFRRFISPDDTAYLDPETPNGLNLYCYCNNDPVNYCDPSGHSVVALILGITAVLGFGLAVGGVATDNNLMTAIGLTMVAVPALISGGMALACLGATGTMVMGGVTATAGVGASLFASAEYQEAFTSNNWMSGALGEDLYNTLMLTTAAIATAGTIASMAGVLNYQNFGNSNWYGGWKKMRSHYLKHGRKMGYRNVFDYTNGAKAIINNGGVYASKVNAYIQWIAGKRYFYVGVGHDSNLITTYFIKDISYTKYLSIL